MRFFALSNLKEANVDMDVFCTMEEIIELIERKKFRYLLELTIPDISVAEIISGIWDLAGPRYCYYLSLKDRETLVNLKFKVLNVTELNIEDSLDNLLNKEVR